MLVIVGVSEDFDSTKSWPENQVSQADMIL